MLSKIEYMMFNEYLNKIGGKIIPKCDIVLNHRFYHNYKSKFNQYVVKKHDCHYITYKTFGANCVAILDNIVIGHCYNYRSVVSLFVDSVYRNIGIGLELINIIRTQYPFLMSGGLSSTGHRNIYKFYILKIKNYMMNNGYYNDIKNGVIAKEDVMKIISSIKDI